MARTHTLTFLLLWSGSFGSIKHVIPRWLVQADSGCLTVCTSCMCESYEGAMPVCRPSQQKGLQRQRAPSRLSREVSAEEAFMLAHASECAAEVARQPATGSVLHAACQKLHDEQRAAQKAAILHPCCASSSPMDVEGTMTTTGLNKRGRRRSITDMPIPEGAELSTVHGICGSPVVSPHVLASTSCSLTEVRTSMDPLVLPL